MNERCVVFTSRDGELFQNISLINDQQIVHKCAVNIDHVEPWDLITFIYQWNDYGILDLEDGIFLDQTTDPSLANLLPGGTCVSEKLT